MNATKLRAKLLSTIEEQEFLEASPIAGARQRRKVALCRRRARLENQIADTEYEAAYP